MVAKKLWGNEWSENMSTPEGYQEILDLTYTTSDPRNLTVKFLKNFLQQERKEGANVLYDAGGGQKEVMEEILEIAKDSGFHTTLIYVRTPLEVSQQRNSERPRSLPTEMVSNYHKKVKDNIRNLIDVFDNVWFVDNKDLIDISNRPTENIEKVK